MIRLLLRFSRMVWRTLRGEGWLRTRIVAPTLGLALMLVVALGIFLFGWDWKALVGWEALVDYINPNDATGRKDAVQVYALIVAGVIASITATVGFLNLRLTRKNLEQQRELAQGTALQAYYEQIGKLLTEHDLLGTPRLEIRELARGQTLTILRGVDGNGKASLLTFLHGARLIERQGETGATAVSLSGADLKGANLKGANLEKVNLNEANLTGANLSGAILQFADLEGTIFQGTNLKRANLENANLLGADFRGADLEDARLEDADIENTDFSMSNITDEQLDDTAPID